MNLSDFWNSSFKWFIFDFDETIGAKESRKTIKGCFIYKAIIYSFLYQNKIEYWWIFLLNIFLTSIDKKISM